MKKFTHKNLLQNIIESGLVKQDEIQHSTQVCKLCSMLFGGLQDIHRMGNTELIWLQTAALLHDVGKSACRKEHNKYSRDIIIESDKFGFSKKQRIIVGLIARYHRGIFPSRCHKYYGKLDSESRYYVRKLSALLRLADGLDGNHESSVKALACQITEDNIIIYPETKGIFNPRKAIAKADLLETVFEKDVVIIEQLEPVFPSMDIESSIEPDYTDWQY
jgi:exopolyphosphatase/guanosine-5'-triphosphate,3'-diphosphate pyrophosphatase